MASSRATSHDPFTTGSTATGLAAPVVRNQISQQNMRSGASTVSTNSRQQRDFLAPAHLRRPTSRTRTAPRMEDDVLADTESEQEPTIQRRRPHMRRPRNGSPEARTRQRQRQEQIEDTDIVNRKPDGNYLLDASAPATSSSVVPAYAADHESEHLAATEMYYSILAKKYFTSGAHMSTRLSKQTENNFEQDRPDMMMRLRDEVTQKIEDERWLYESADRY